jgi:hypothetical protein
VTSGESGGKAWGGSKMSFLDVSPVTSLIFIMWMMSLLTSFLFVCDAQVVRGGGK